MTSCSEQNREMPGYGAEAWVAGFMGGPAGMGPPHHRIWTIGRKVVFIVAAFIVVGYALLIGVQIHAFSSWSADLALNRNVHLTQLLAEQVAGGVRWGKVHAIERAYQALTDDPDSMLDSVLVLDAQNQVLSSYFSESYAVDGLQLGVDPAADRLEPGEALVTETADDTLVFVPITVGKNQARVGTLAVAWSRAPLRARVQGALVRQASLGLVTTVGLVVVLVYLLARVATRPLMQVTQTTLRLAQGDTNTPVPFVGRDDEIGDMAQSLEIFKAHLVVIDRLSRKQQRQTERLAEALEREREYNLLQREFVAMASHEFRTPLTIIDGAAQRIERRADRQDPEGIKQKAQKIRHSVQRMITLVESVLSSAGLDAGKFKVNVQPCDLKDIVGTACRRQQEISSDHEIVADLAGLPEEIVGDPRLLDQVISNLLSNAVKYAPDSPRIDVVGRVEGREAIVSVTDRGVGIPEAEQARIFDRYFRASTSTGIAGTGIGLNLAAQTVELHGGHIELESEVGRGSTFRFSLPIRTLAGAEAGPAGGDDSSTETRPDAVAEGAA